MKSILNLAAAFSLALGASAFAAPQAATAPATQATPATPATPATSTTTTTVQPKETPAQLMAEKKHIKADKKAAMAECKKLKGADKTACKKEAEAKEKAALADLKAKK